MASRDAEISAPELAMPESPLAGYAGIGERREPNHKYGLGERRLSNDRFIATSQEALVPVVRCLLAYDVSEDSENLNGGACFGFGRYRGVVFDAWFRLEPGYTEADISQPIRLVIDDMLREQAPPLKTGQP